MKLIDFITTDQYCDMLICRVQRAIKTKRPGNFSYRSINIQQDYFRPHIELFDQTRQMKLQVDLIFQPINSPDLNILDLVFMDVIQSIQH